MKTTNEAIKCAGLFDNFETYHLEILNKSLERAKLFLKDEELIHCDNLLKGILLSMHSKHYNIHK